MWSLFGLTFWLLVACSSGVVYLQFESWLIFRSSWMTGREYVWSDVLPCAYIWFCCLSSFELSLLETPSSGPSLSEFRLCFVYASVPEMTHSQPGSDIWMTADILMLHSCVDSTFVACYIGLLLVLLAVLLSHCTVFLLCLKHWGGYYSYLVSYILVWSLHIRLEYSPRVEFFRLFVTFRPCATQGHMIQIISASKTTL